MKKTLRIREEIAKLQDVLKAAETRDAERIGRIALKAGLGDYEIEDSMLQSAFEEIAQRFQSAQANGRGGEQTGLRQAHGSSTSSQASPNAGYNASSGAKPASAGIAAQVQTDAAQGPIGEA